MINSLQDYCSSHMYDSWVLCGAYAVMCTSIYIFDIIVACELCIGLNYDAFNTIWGGGGGGGCGCGGLNVHTEYILLKILSRHCITCLFFSCHIFVKHCINKCSLKCIMQATELHIWWPFWNSVIVPGWWYNALRNSSSPGRYVKKKPTAEGLFPLVNICPCPCMITQNENVTPSVHRSGVW